MSSPDRTPDDQPVIPLITRLQTDVAGRWQNALSQAMPEARVVPFDELAPAERRAARVAVIANPDPAELAELPNLIWLQSLWAGVDSLATQALPENCPVVRLVDPDLAQTMARAALTHVLAFQQNLPLYREQQAARRWHQHPLTAPSEMPVGILGMGELGRATAAMLRAQGFPVMGWSRSGTQAPGVVTLSGEAGLDRLLAEAAVVLVLLPLTTQTRGLLSEDRLARARPGAVLINFGRGPIVDSAALIRQLDAGRWTHAVLDVFENEPLPAADPLWSHPKVTVLPHVSAPTNTRTASRVVAENIAAFLADGTVPPGVDWSRGY